MDAIKTKKELERNLNNLWTEYHDKYINTKTANQNNFEKFRNDVIDIVLYSEASSLLTNKDRSNIISDIEEIEKTILILELSKKDTRIYQYRKDLLEKANIEYLRKMLEDKKVIDEYIEKNSKDSTLDIDSEVENKTNSKEEVYETYDEKTNLVNEIIEKDPMLEPYIDKLNKLTEKELKDMRSDRNSRRLFYQNAISFDDKSDIEDEVENIVREAKEEKKKKGFISSLKEKFKNIKEKVMDEDDFETKEKEETKIDDNEREKNLDSLFNIAPKFREIESKLSVLTTKELEKFVLNLELREDFYKKAVSSLTKEELIEILVNRVEDKNKTEIVKEVLQEKPSDELFNIFYDNDSVEILEKLALSEKQTKEEIQNKDEISLEDKKDANNDLQKENIIKDLLRLLPWDVDTVLVKRVLEKKELKDLIEISNRSDIKSILMDIALGNAKAYIKQEDELSNNNQEDNKLEEEVLEENKTEETKQEKKESDSKGLLESFDMPLYENNEPTKEELISKILDKMPLNIDLTPLKNKLGQMENEKLKKILNNQVVIDNLIDNLTKKTIKKQEEKETPKKQEETKKESEEYDEQQELIDSIIKRVSNLVDTIELTKELKEIPLEELRKLAHNKKFIQFLNSDEYLKPEEKIEEKEEDLPDLNKLNKEEAIYALTKEEFERIERIQSIQELIKQDDRFLSNETKNIPIEELRKALKSKKNREELYLKYFSNEEINNLESKRTK